MINITLNWAGHCNALLDSGLLKTGIPRAFRPSEPAPQAPWRLDLLLLLGDPVPHTSAHSPALLGLVTFPNLQLFRLLAVGQGL